MNYRYAGGIGLLLLVASAPVFLVSDDTRGEAAVRAPVTLATVVQSAPRSGGRDLGYYLGISADPEKTRQAVAAVQNAISLAEKQKYSAALDEYDRALTLLPALGDWLRVFSAGVAATAGDTAEVNRRLTSLDSLLLEEWAWRSRLRAHRNAYDRAGALRIAREAAEQGSARRRAEGWRAIGEIELQRGDSAAAKVAFANTMRAWPYSEVALDAARALSGLRDVSAYDQLNIGRIYMRWGNRERGLDGLAKYLRSPNAHPDTVMRVRFEIGQAHFNAGKYTDAQRILKLVSDNSVVAPDARFLAARAAYRANRAAEGRAGFLELIQRFPNSEAATTAWFMIGDMEHDAQNVAAAENAFRRAAQAGGTSERAGIAHMRLATIALSRGDTAEALTRLEAYRSVFTTGARNQQASYWIGKLHATEQRAQVANARLGDAAEQNPWSYYGLRATELLNDGDVAEFAPDPVTEPAVMRQVNAALARLDVLYELGWTEAAVFELRRVREYFAAEPTALIAVAEGLIERERATNGIAIGQELLRSGAVTHSRRLMRTVYPLPHRQLIVKEARRNGIDPYLMAALIRQESAFNPKATSGAGAMGLMQVMPTTGKALARSMGIKRFKSSMLHDPDINVRIGARFLADMIRTWDGRPDYVLVAYNAGPSRIARWRRLPEARDPELFMERIPFDETRDYVRVVQLNRRIYELLYSPEEAFGGGQK